MIKVVIIILGIISLGYQGQASQYNFYSHKGQDYNSANYYKTSPDHKPKIDQAERLKKHLNSLIILKKAFTSNHTNCENRQECWRLDQQSLTNLQKEHIYDEGMQDLLADFRQEMKKAADTDIVVTEWSIYNSLSEHGKQQYLKGVQINAPKQLRSKENKSPRYSSNVGKISKFNSDDLKLYLLQEVKKNHSNCNERNSCLKADLKLVNEISANLQDDKSNHGVFEQISEAMKELAVKQSFNTIRFCAMYYDKLEHHYAILYKSDDRRQWNELSKNVHPITPRDPKIMNRKEVKDKVKPENKMKEKLRENGKNVVNKLLDNFLGEPQKKPNHKKDNNEHQDLNPANLLGQLFGK